MQFRRVLGRLKYRTISKGYNIWALVGIATAFVVITVVLSIGSEIIGEMGDTFYDGGTTGYNVAYNVTQKGLESLETFGDWLPTLALVVIASVIIGVIIAYLVMRLFKGGTAGV